MDLEGWQRQSWGAESAPQRSEEGRRSLDSGNRAVQPMPSAPEDTTLGTSLASRRRMTRSGTCKGTYTRPAVIVKQKADRVGDAKAVIGRDAIASKEGGSSAV